MVKHDHPEFYSDLFLLLSAINAKLTINTAADESKMYSMEEFLDLHMNRKVITKITFPALDDRTHILRSYKARDFAIFVVDSLVFLSKVLITLLTN